MPSLKARRECDVSSRFKQLVVGMKLHLVDIKKTTDGTIRACVVVLTSAHISSENPIGWITVQSRAARPQ